MKKNILRLSAMILCLTMCLAIFSSCGRKQVPEQTEMSVTSEPGEIAAETLTEAAAEETTVESEPPAESTEATEEASDAEVLTLPDTFPVTLTFSSGVGAWYSSLTLNPDGTFIGEYSDSEMSEMAEEYPSGTVYTSTFSGRFEIESRLDEYSYALNLTGLHTEKEAEEEWIEDGFRYVAAEPAGLTDCTEFILYSPETPTEGLSEEFLSWWPARFENEKPDTLSGWGLYNTAGGQGFFSYDSYL